MNQTALCPECGANVAFSHPAALLHVCSYCRSVLRRLDRQDLVLEKIGQSAPVVDLGSPLSLSQRGAAYGGFTVVGRLQLDHGAGTWDEWYLGLDNGKWLWLAEAQRRYYLTAPMGPAPTAPPFAAARVGHTVHVPALSDAGQPTEVVLRVTERNTATVVAAEGDLPFQVRPGDSVRYLDLQGPRRSFGTLDYGAEDDPDPPFAYVGTQVNLEDLHLDRPAAPPPQRPAIKAARLSCPECQGALELRAPDQSLRVVCPYCRALLDTTKEPLAALSTLDPYPKAPDLPLGATVTLRGCTYTTIGHMRRGVVGTGDAWDEYVLLPAPGSQADGGFHYLIDSSGHYTLTRPIHLGDLGDDSGPRRRYRDRVYHRVEDYHADVLYLSGEFPWAVEVGERVAVSDYAREGAILSVERSDGDRSEIVASLGDYLDPKEVFAAFALTDKRDVRMWVAPHQPNPHRPTLRRQGPMWAVTTAVMILLTVLFGVRASSRKTHFTANLRTVAGQAPTPEHVYFSDPFPLGQPGASPAPVAVELSAPLDNTWLGADLALVGEDDGAVYVWGSDISYYHGVDGGESWSEGSPSDTSTVPAVPPGRYVLRVEPAWPVYRPCDTSKDCPGAQRCDANRCMRSCSTGAECGAGQTCLEGQCVMRDVPYKVTVTWGVSRPALGFFLILLLTAFPFITWLRLRHFEQRRKEDM